MNTWRIALLVGVLAASVLAPKPLLAQIGGVQIPDKTQLLDQATAVNTELAKPQVEPSRLTQLADQLGDLQKQAGALEGLVR